MATIADLLQQVYKGNLSEKELHRKLQPALFQQLKGHGIPENSAVALVRGAIEVLIRRASKNQYLSEYGEKEIHQLLKNYLKEQHITYQLKKMLKNRSHNESQKYLQNCRPIIERQLTYANPQLRKEVIEDAVSDAFEIFLKNLTNSDFRLYSSILTYLTSVAQHKCTELIRQKRSVVDVKEETSFFYWEELFENEDEKNAIFDFIESELIKFSDNDCATALQKGLNLFDTLVQNEQIEVNHLAKLFRLVSQEVSEKESISLVKFENCYKKFVISTFPIIPKTLKGILESWIKKEIDKVQIRIEAQKKHNQVYQNRIRQKTKL